MPKGAKVSRARGLFLHRHIEEFRKRVTKFQSMLSRRKAGAWVEDFDEDVEKLIGGVFGEASDELEAYQYAELGEASSLINMPEEAQEGGSHDTFQESLQQRKRVLESCVAALEMKRDMLAVRSTNGPGDQALSRLSVANFMSDSVRSVHQAETVREAGRLLQKWKVGSLLVDDGSRYIGIITDTDLSRKAVARGLDPNATTVKQCMSRSVVTIEDSESLADALALMKEHGIRHLPVTEDGTIIGVLSVADLLKAYGTLLGEET